MIRLDVKLLPQEDEASCWHACLDMVFDYFDAVDCGNTLYKNAFIQKLYKNCDGLGHADVYKIRHQFGDKGKRKLRKMPKTINRQSLLDPLNLGRLLTRFGPLYCGGWFGGAAGKGGGEVGKAPHVIVITGVDMRNGTVYYNDPWPIRGGYLDKTMEIAQLVQNLDWNAPAEANDYVEVGKDLHRCWMLHYSEEKGERNKSVKVLTGEALRAREEERLKFKREVVDNNRWSYGLM
jgi:hypothetical protein